MKTSRYLAALLLTGALVAGPVLADKQIDDAVFARQSLMKLIGYNVGLLGGMAQGKVPYDADAARNAAENLTALSSLHLLRMFPEGSDNVALTGATRAKPEIWENTSDFLAKFAALNKASAAMVEPAGTDLAALQSAIGAVGGACGACHKIYRGPKN